MNIHKMFKKAIKDSFFRFKQKRTIHQLKSAATIASEKCDIEKIRNIGILAHIDAGKTTTTERMLYYSGIIREMGEVHDGNTVTDFMEQERKRGITICSAAVTFGWKGHRFNLIDTPGHIDFTMGVEQSLGALDGVVIILDGSAGVEPQTVTVWRQADRYNLPRMVYVNKMDRSDGDYDKSVKSLESKLEAITFPIHYPFRDQQGFNGIIDVITLEKIVFDKESHGRNILKTPVSEDSSKLFNIVKEKRKELTDKLSGLDDELANFVIEQNSLDGVSPQMLVDSLRRVTIAKNGVPVLLGSSYKNMGVQPLMDGIILYLPTPNLNKLAKQYHCFEKNFSARVFKVIHDKQRGPITFFRVFSGSLTKGQRLYNVQSEKIEQITKLYAAYADDYEEISEVSNGNIAAVTGLKWTKTGDLLTSSVSVANKAKENMIKKNIVSKDNVEKIFSVGTNIPDPVFFCSIEAPSLAYVDALEEALEQLIKEDPSLRVANDEETDQTVLAGMGELHIEVVKERIRSDYKIDVDLGELQIAYKETIEKPFHYTHKIEVQVGRAKSEVLVTLSLIPDYKDTEILTFDWKNPEHASNLAGINAKAMSLIKKGVVSGLSRGPKMGCPVINVGVKLHWFEAVKGTSDPVIIAAVSQCIRKMLEGSDSILLEPIMDLEVVTLDETSSKVMTDLQQRKAEIKTLDSRGAYKIISCSVPLSELLGYSSKMRQITSGNGTFTMEFSHYRKMDISREEEALKKSSGF